MEKGLQRPSKEVMIKIECPAVVLVSSRLPEVGHRSSPGASVTELLVERRFADILCYKHIA